MVGGDRDGILLGAGIITNQGTISATSGYGIDVTSAATVTNAGTITGGNGIAVYFGAGAQGQLSIDPGAVFNGNADDVAGTGTINLAPGIASGTLSGFNAKYIGFSQINVDPGAHWTLAASQLNPGQTIAASDSLTIAGGLINNGVISAGASAIVFTSSLSGTGTVSAGAGGAAVFDGSVAATQTIQNNGTIFINDPAEFEAAVTGSGVEIIACFAAGTHIATAAGAVPVEHLKLGDLLHTADAGLQKIKWLGTRTYASPFAARNHMVLPIRIQAGAIADRIPARDLWVSPGHAIYIAGMFIHAWRLINGISITQVSAMETITYFHIEMENHEIILAENCPVETFMDENFRLQFHNAAEFAALYPGQVATQASCRQRLEGGPVLHAIQRRLAARARTNASAGRRTYRCPKRRFGWIFSPAAVSLAVPWPTSIAPISAMRASAAAATALSFRAFPEPADKSASAAAPITRNYQRWLAQSSPDPQAHPDRSSTGASGLRTRRLRCSRRPCAAPIGSTENCCSAIGCWWPPSRSRGPSAGCCA